MFEWVPKKERREREEKRRELTFMGRADRRKLVLCFSTPAPETSFNLAPFASLIVIYIFSSPSQPFYLSRRSYYYFRLLFLLSAPFAKSTKHTMLYECLHVLLSTSSSKERASSFSAAEPETDTMPNVGLEEKSY